MLHTCRNHCNTAVVATVNSEEENTWLLFLSFLNDTFLKTALKNILYSNFERKTKLSKVKRETYCRLNNAQRKTFLHFLSHLDMK